jgi:hypothetical protein
LAPWSCLGDTAATGSTNHFNAIASGGYRNVLATTPPTIIRVPMMRGRNVDFKIR